jgi:hypothetical protein
MSAAAPRTNVRADILEKDYWNSQVLRTASASHPTDFVFKGGTSLSKAYRCTQRFSEDIDVLILRRELGSGARDKLMKEIAGGAVEELELTVDPSKHSHGKGEHLTEALRYPRQVTGAAILSPDVLLEMGIRGSDEPPHLILPIEPLITGLLREVNFEVDEYEDLVPFMVPVLHPGRTLVEKVMILHTKVTSGTWSNGGSLNDPSRIGRHYHDIHRLLELPGVREWLENREEFLAAVADHEAINRECFNIEVPPRPAGGYSMSDAFRSDFFDNNRLGSFYEGAMNDLFIGPGTPPPWIDVMTTIQGAAELL